MIQKKRANLKDQSSLALEQKYVQDARKSSLMWIINTHEMEENILLLFTFPYFVGTDEKVKYITFPNTSPNTFDKQMFEEQVFNNFIIE